ncbi:Zinc transporter ZIP2 [Aphelenchoides besseyi]|nr:Zinc transporter ZIP2 [Aphelenchoides besseyi]
MIRLSVFMRHKVTFNFDVLENRLARDDKRSLTICSRNRRLNHEQNEHQSSATFTCYCNICCNHNYWSNSSSDKQPILQFARLTYQKSAEMNWFCRTLTLTTCGSGGVFFSIVFLSILPHLRSMFDKYRVDYQSNSYPYPEFIACASFFLTESEVVRQQRKKVMQKLRQLMFQFRSQNDSISLPSMDLKLSNRGSLILMPTDEKQNENIDDAHKETVVNLNPRFSIVNVHELVLEESVRFAAKKETVLWKSLVFMLSIGLHSFIEGCALGVLKEGKSMLLLFSALLFHKSVESFKISLKLCDLKTSGRLVLYFMIIIYSSMTPLGSISTQFLLNSRIEEQIGDMIAIVLASASAGAFFYIAFFDILDKERENDHSNLAKLGAVFFGFLVVAIVQAYNQFA